MKSLEEIIRMNNEYAEIELAIQAYRQEREEKIIERALDGLNELHKELKGHMAVRFQYPRISLPPVPVERQLIERFPG